MITLEQIRLLEGKISRAIELIHALKEENATLRKGLESAQKRMQELEVMVDGFKSDQKEIESVIVRTLHNLDELEEKSTAKRPERAPGLRAADASGTSMPGAPAQAPEAPAPPHPAQAALSPDHAGEHAEKESPEAGPRPPKEELDIF